MFSSTIQKEQQTGKLRTGNETRRNWNWLALEVNQKSFLSGLDRISGRLLDIGCGDKPYENLIIPHVTEYVGIENPVSKQNVRYDIKADALQLPFKDSSFDTVICLQVMEHVTNPSLLLKEIYRVLRKPDCCLILSTPFLWGVHESPRDYFRFTKFGLKLLLDEVGFNVIKIVPQCGYWVATSLHLTYYLHQKKYFRKIPLSYLLDVIQWFGKTMDKIDFDERNAGSYLSIASTRSPI